MNSEKSPKLKLTEKIKAVGNVLVTVSRNPSVDELSAALGLTFLLDKLGKHATAVFSGDIPPAINFLEPEKTFENNADSLRDFIISLDKEKADRLRYKVEGDLVRVFITPYKTKISADDLTFEEGDFNVELVIAIGVDKKDDLDEAIAAHGRIFHDATVATLLLGGAKDSLGTISWQSATASSFSEMAAELADGLGTKDKPLVDEQIATALLTGVVAATDQFRNDKTSPSVMSLAADLMAKGANQQLIASELAAAEGEISAQPAAEKIETAAPGGDNSLGEMAVGHDAPTPSEETMAPAPTDTVTAGATMIAPTNAETTAAAEPAAPAEDQVAAESAKFAAEQSQDALAAAQAQLTETQLNQNNQVEPAPQPSVEPAPQPAAEPSIAPVVEPTPAPLAEPPLPQLPVVQEPLVPVSPELQPQPTAAAEAEAQLDNLVQQNAPASSTLDDLRAAVNSAADAGADSGLSHGVPYAESTVSSPLNAALMNDEPASVDPFATSTLPADTTVKAPSSPLTDQTMINQNATLTFASAAPQAADQLPPLPQPTDLGLPLPPPLPPVPALGQLPTADMNGVPLAPQPAITPPAETMPQPEMMSPEMAPTETAPQFAQPAAAPLPQAVDASAAPLFPPVDTGAADPTQYHIPS